MMIFHWSLSDSKSPKVSRILLLPILTIDGFDSPTDFQFLQFLLQDRGDRSERIN